MPKNKLRDNGKTVYLPPELWEKIREEAKEKMISQVAVIRMILANHYKNK